MKYLKICALYVAYCLDRCISAVKGVFKKGGAE